MIDNARTVTDTKTLWGEDPDKRNSCSAFICLNYSHFRVQSYLNLHFLHFFVRRVKTTLTECFPCSLVELILFQLLSEVESTQEGHYKLSIQPILRNINSLSDVLQNKILPADF